MEKKNIFNRFKSYKVFSVISLPIVVIISILLFYFYILKDLPNPAGLKNYRVIPVSSQILDRKGKLLYEIYKDQNRTPVKLSDLPIYVKEATISIEDRDFYKHQGVSIFGGIARALKDMIFLKKGLQGGSTITQQLVKSALLTPERTIRRKIKEVILALWAEKILTKDEILELYLNQVPYGGTSYGIEAGAKTFFDKSAMDLSLSEAALLAGLPRAPSLYSPFADPDLAKKRRNEVLKKMYELKYISEDEKNKAQSESLNIVEIKSHIKAPHFVFYVKSLLEKEYGVDKVEKGGLKVYTTLDSDIEEKSEAILKEELMKIKNLQVSNGAILVTRPATGEILSMIGSVDYFATGSGSFNVTTALRQPGSSIKPINYAIGIERRLVTASSVFLDVPTCFTYAGQSTPYCPRNYDGQFHGLVQLRYALGNSYNIPAVKMLELNGVANFVASSPAFLITSLKDPKRYGLSLTLGGGEVRMTEMAQAFSAFANEGVPKKLVAVLKVEDKYGNKIYEYNDINYTKDVDQPIDYPNFLAIPGERAISKETAFIISHILSDNGARSNAFGASSTLVIGGKTVAVKTGTTNDKRDNWTIGYTPNFMTLVWVGNNDNTPMNPSLTSGITGAAPIWHQVMSEILRNQQNLNFRIPSTVVGRHVCTDTGQIVGQNPDGTENCPSRFEYLVKGTESISANFKVNREVVPVSRDTGKLTKPDDPAAEMQEKTIIHDSSSIYCVDCTHDNSSPTP